MAGLGLVERVAEDCFTANAITNHMVAMPSAQHGALHLSVSPMHARFCNRNYKIFQARTNPTQHHGRANGWRILDEKAPGHPLCISLR
jgi:hypothetical protein